MEHLEAFKKPVRFWASVMIVLHLVVLILMFATLAAPVWVESTHGQFGFKGSISSVVESDFFSDDFYYDIEEEYNEKIEEEKQRKEEEEQTQGEEQEPSEEEEPDEEQEPGEEEEPNEEQEPGEDENPNGEQEPSEEEPLGEELDQEVMNAIMLLFSVLSFCGCCFCLYETLSMCFLLATVMMYTFTFCTIPTYLYTVVTTSASVFFHTVGFINYVAFQFLTFSGDCSEFNDGDDFERVCAKSGPGLALFTCIVYLLLGVFNCILIKRFYRNKPKRPGTHAMSVVDPDYADEDDISVEV